MLCVSQEVSNFWTMIYFGRVSRLTRRVLLSGETGNRICHDFFFSGNRRGDRSGFAAPIEISLVVRFRYSVSQRSEPMDGAGVLESPARGSAEPPHPPFAGTVSVSASERRENEQAAAEAACVARELLDGRTSRQKNGSTNGQWKIEQQRRPSARSRDGTATAQSGHYTNIHM